MMRALRLATRQNESGPDPIRLGRAAIDIAAVDLVELHAIMASPYGLDVRDRMHRMHLYRNCFVASEAIDWLVDRHGLSRGNAVRLAQRMLAIGLIRHVLDEHDFSDAPLFFAFVRNDNPGSAEQEIAKAVDLVDMHEIENALRSPEGVPARDHSRWFVRYPGCVSGAEVTAWIIRRYGLPRPHAVEIGRRLLASGAIRHVFDELDFVDASILYRYV